MLKSITNILIISFLLAGCNLDSNQKKSYEISFNVKAKKEDLKIFQDGVIPWISIENPERDLSRLIDLKEIVIKKNKVILIISYPLKKTVEFKLNSNVGFTREILIKEISNKYKYIYQKEKESTQVKVIPIGQRKEYVNRNFTDGLYGIWGHDIGDLDLSVIQVTEDNGNTYLILSIES